MTTLGTAAERLGAYLANQGERFPEDVIDYVMVRSKSGSRAYDRLDLTMPDLRNVLAENQRLTDAFERLIMRIHRDFNFDAGECAPPEGETALRMMDDLVRYTEELSLKLETGGAL